MAEPSAMPTATRSATRVNTKALVGTMAAAAFMLASVAFGFAYDFKNGRVQGIADPVFMERHSGKIFLQVEENGEAWYVSPTRENWRFFMCRPSAAFDLMRDHSIGITNADLERVKMAEDSAPPLGGVDPHVGDSPDAALGERLSGYILLQVEDNGEAWYVWPETNERYYLGRSEDAFAVMRLKGYGITNTDLLRLPIHADSLDPTDPDGCVAGDAAENDLLSPTEAITRTEKKQAKKKDKRKANAHHFAN